MGIILSTMAALFFGVAGATAAPPPPPQEAPTIETLFHYPARIMSVYDADTMTVSFDLGISGLTAHSIKVRLARIDAPEMRGEEREHGIVARDYLVSVVSGQTLIIKHLWRQKDPWGRLIVEVWLDEVNLSDHLVETGHAIYKDY